MAGGMVQLGTREIGYFYGDLVETFAMFMNTYRTMNKWVRSEGDGLFSALGAADLRRLIKATIEGENSEVPLNWAPLSIEQVLFKEKYGMWDQTWKMTGSLRASVVAVKRSGAWVVGIDKRVSVKKIGFRNLAKTPTTKGQKIRVETYAEWMEFGTNRMPARPLFGPVTEYFIAAHIPELIGLMDKSIARSAKWNIGSDNYSRTMNPESDFSSSIVSENNIFDGVSKLSSKARAQTQYIDRMDNQEISDFCSRHSIDFSDLSPEQIAEIRKFGYR